MSIYLNKLMTGKNLTRYESYALFCQMATYPLFQQAEILSAFAKKKETKEELLGAMDALLEHSISIDYPHDVLDMVGTGGDGAGTFNISTASSLVVASCGVTVAKHGGKRVTSPSGSTDVLTALGIPMPRSSKSAITQLKTLGYTYLWAPLFNPLLSSFTKVRKQLGVATLLHALGPLINPIRPKRQLLGVSQPHLLATMPPVLKASGLDRAWVVHSDDGLDELSISAPSTIIELQQGLITEYRITPEDVGLNYAPLQDVAGGNSADNASIIRDLFSGKLNGAKLDIVILNSAAGLLIAERVSTLKEGVDMAHFAIMSGKTADFLCRLQNVLIPGEGL